ncbi:MAG: hypothetical protein ACAH07_07370 [Methylophilaceae bacterium]
MNSKSFFVKTDRFYSAHHALLRIAEDNLLKATTKEPGWFDSQFTSIALSSLIIEAFCNAVGQKVVNKWTDFESASPLAKLRLICEHLDIDYDTSIEPWSSLVWLIKIRNLIAHPKAEPIKHEAVISEKEYAKQRYRDIPKSKLEKEITLGNARKSLRAVNQMIDLFCEKLTPEQNFGISGNMWSSSAKKHQVEAD